MGTRGKKVGLEVMAEIIRLSKEYSPGYIARHLRLHRSTVSKLLKREIEERVMVSRSFHKHSDDLTHSFKQTVSNLVSNKELLYSLLVHFKQEFPEFAHLNTWQDVNGKDINKGVFEKMELLADSRSFKFCAKCPICEAIGRRLRK